MKQRKSTSTSRRKAARRSPRFSKPKAARKANNVSPAPFRPGSALQHCKRTEGAARILRLIRPYNPGISVAEVMEIVGFSPEQCKNDRLQRRVLRRRTAMLIEAAARLLLKPPQHPLIIETSDDATVSLITTPSVLGSLAEEDQSATSLPSVLNGFPDPMIEEDETEASIIRPPRLGIEGCITFCLAYLEEVLQRRSSNNKLHGRPEFAGPLNEDSVVSITLDRLVEFEEEQENDCSNSKSNSNSNSNNEPEELAQGDGLVATRQHRIYQRVYRRICLRLRHDEEKKHKDQILATIRRKISERFTDTVLTAGAGFVFSATAENGLPRANE
mmetsp:Transcript_12648/g.29617  ORF Transcript_12648/g.29617 Transcript_12648/m.29617 type:complete len:330 (+) Transcript_12648:176-1165(+)